MLTKTNDKHLNYNISDKYEDLHQALLQLFYHTGIISFIQP